MHSLTERDAEIRLWAFLTQARSFARPQQPLKHRGLFGHGVPRWTTVLAAGATGPYSQIALSDAHSPAVNSGGPVKGPSSLFMRARRSSVSGWLDRIDRVLSPSLPVTRNSNSPIAFGERPSRCMVSIEKLSAFCSASRE